MGLFKGLFVGVHASNATIRILFLPTCYLLLSTPFLLILSRYYRLDSKLTSLLGHRSFADILLQLFVGLIAFLLPTRIISGKRYGASQDERKRRVQQLPYWIPGVRHWVNVVFRGERWLEGVRYVRSWKVED